MFNKDFFPTPQHVIDIMLIGVDIQDKVFLEPSSGNGNIIDYLKINGAKDVLCCETNKDLAIISGKKGKLIENDFLNVKPEQVSHVNYIIANPPFSADEKHILHMWEVAPGGCTIVSLFNYQTYDLAYSSERKQLKRIIHENGSVENLGDVFSDAERKTDVQIGLVKLHKPKTSSDDEFDGYFDVSEEHEQQENGLMGYNEVRNIVNRYVGAVKMFDEVMSKNYHINELIKPISSNLDITFGAVSRKHYSIDRDTFKKELQKSSWRTVFSKMKMDKYTTSSIMSQLNKFVETQEKVPFSMSNIYKMIDLIVGTHGDRMGKVLIEIFDWLTERHHDNRHQLEGWKTNSMYFVGMKFIAPYCGVSTGYRGQPEIRWSSSGEKMDELTKALCVLTGQNYDNFESLHDFFREKKVSNDKEAECIKKLSEEFGIKESRAALIHQFSKYAASSTNDVYYRRFWDITAKISREDLDRYKAFYELNRFSSDCWGEKYESKEWGKWLDWGFFEIRVYKKGTLHAKFKDEKVWERFNIECAKAKGWALPTNIGSDVRRKETGVEIYQN
jgi:hypothetical protein